MYKKYILLILSMSMNLFANIVPKINNIATEGEDFTTWLALFGLGIISIFALFLSSEKIRAFKKKYKEKEKVEQKIKESQDEVLSKIGENINVIAKDTNKTKSENQLLAITTNLIDFLRIKSKKVEILNNKIKLSNLLNDVSGTLKSNVKGKDLELIYDIEDDISEILTSDTLNISKILVNTLLYCIENNSKMIVLKISKNSLFSKNDQLFFTINSNLKINAEDTVSIFKSNYNETTDEYDSLALFIAKELALLMRGDLIARNDKDENLEFVFNIPYCEDEQEQNQQPQNLKAKNILVIDSMERTSLQIKDILTSLGHSVKIIDPKDFFLNLNYFYMYDLLFLGETLFTNKVVSTLEDTNIKIISISNIFETSEKFPNSETAEFKISKPLTVWQISDLLLKIGNSNENAQQDITNTVINSGNCLVHRNSFQDTRNISIRDFTKFQGKKILLVEDNIINQKVFIGVLGKSNINISVANHGKEALDILTDDKNFDIIFMDINMPVIDGYVASIKIREKSKYDDIPIIALSTLNSNDEVSKMFTCGMNGYLSKPLKKEKLFTVLSIFLQATTDIQELKVEKELEKPIDIYGLNIELGISKSSSSEIFYKEILKEFKDAYGEVDKVLEKLVNDFRYEQLKILCVDLKGLTGTIGAENLNMIITDTLEKLSLKKYESIPMVIQKYKKELQLVNTSINTYLTTNT